MRATWPVGEAASDADARASKAGAGEVLWEISNWAAGAFVPMPTPPEARTMNWLVAVEAKSPPVESDQTKAPE